MANCSSCDLPDSQHEGPALRERLDHYIASRWMLERALGDHPVVKALAVELEALQSLPPSAAAARA
jgi:hypothetical protein